MKQRLIDANVARSIFNILAEKGPEESIRIWEQCVSIIDDVETVDAIPVEWIRKYIDELLVISKDNLDLGEDGYFSEIVTIEDMLEDWRKENETNRCR